MKNEPSSDEDPDLETLILLATTPAVSPRACLREKVLAKATAEKALPKKGYSFVGDAEGVWQDLPTPGARIKELSAGRDTGRAVLILELDPGTHFPSHRHGGVEELLVLSGDLDTAGTRMQAGDFMRAETGTTHSDVFSENGCRALLITDQDDHHPTTIRTYSTVRRLIRRTRSLLSMAIPKN